MAAGCELASECGFEAQQSRHSRDVFVSGQVQRLDVREKPERARGSHLGEYGGAHATVIVGPPSTRDPWPE